MKKVTQNDGVTVMGRDSEERLILGESSDNVFLWKHRGLSYMKFGGWFFQEIENTAGRPSSGTIFMHLRNIKIIVVRTE